jgi:hypothetical protein
MNTRTTTWLAQIVAVAVLLTAGSASASSGLLSGNSPLGKNTLEGGYYRVSASISAETHQGCGEDSRSNAADFFVAPRQPVHLDIGGEGRYPGAINVNPNTTTSTTGTAGRPIPNLVQATGEQLPFANQSASLITIENTPISQATASNVARVISPGGEIRLVSPADYAATAHQRVIQALPPGATFTQTTVGTGETAVTTTIIRVPGGTP